MDSGEDALLLFTTRVSNRNSVARNCEQGSNLTFAELRETELLFHLKINNFKCDLQIYAADTRIKISL